MDSPKATLEDVVESYVGRGLNGYAYRVNDPTQAVFIVISVGYVKGQRLVDANLIARLVGDTILLSET